MAVCGKCADPMTNAKECLTCADCKNSYHVACTRVETVEKFKKLSAQRKSAWKCDGCKAETLSSASKSDCESAVLESIQMLKRELSAQISTVNANVEAVKTQITDVNHTIGTMQQTLCSLVAENEQRRVEMDRVVKENSELKECVFDLTQKVLDLEQYSRRDNIEIVGIPYSNGEDTYGLLERVAKVLKIAYSRQDISTAHRLTASSVRPNPAIIVRFVARDCKMRWMTAAKEHRKRLSAAELYETWPASWIYVNDHLTTHNKTILGRARRLVRERKLAFAWTKDGRVFARKTAAPDSPVKFLKSMDDLDDLLND